MPKAEVPARWSRVQRTVTVCVPRETSGVSGARSARRRVSSCRGPGCGRRNVKGRGLVRRFTSAAWAVQDDGVGVPEDTDSDGRVSLALYLRSGSVLRAPSTFGGPCPSPWAAAGAVSASPAWVTCHSPDREGVPTRTDVRCLVFDRGSVRHSPATLAAAPGEGPPRARAPRSMAAAVAEPKIPV